MKKPFVISIVDDDEIYRFVIRKDLEALKIPKKIIPFSDGEEAIDFMMDNLGNNDNLPDLIFLDINMPIMDGFQFMEEFVELKPRAGKPITVYMISSSVDPSDIERAKSISEISDYILKPVESDKLTALVEELEQNGRL